MSATEEPVEKKPRRTREIVLDLTLFPDWVGEASDSALLEVFAIGVKVKDSIAINITENPQAIKNVLSDNLQPVHDQVKIMSQTFVNVQNGVKTSLTKIQSDVKELTTDLVSKVQEVVNKVPPDLNENLTKLVTRYTKSSVIGDLGEADVQSILRAHFDEYTIEDVSSETGKGDIHITSTQSRQKYLVEVKNRKDEVPAAEIRKFEKNVRENKDFKVGILFSLKSGIDVRASHGRFKIKFQDNQYYIYVANALNDGKDLIVWIVVLADQLAGLNQGLTDKQTSVVENLLKEFQSNVNTSKNCRTNLDSLKRTVADLEKNMDPLLKIIEKAKRSLNSALNKDG